MEDWSAFLYNTPDFLLCSHISDTVNDENDAGGVTADPHFRADRYRVVVNEQEEPSVVEDALSALKAALGHRSCFVPVPGLIVSPLLEFLQAFLPRAPWYVPLPVQLLR